MRRRTRDARAIVGIPGEPNLAARGESQHVALVHADAGRRPLPIGRNSEGAALRPLDIAAAVVSAAVRTAVGRTGVEVAALRAPEPILIATLDAVAILSLILPLVAVG